MHELIFRFLLDTGYPRASIMTDHRAENLNQSYQPAFLIVDPVTTNTLAVIDVVESGNREDLSSHALHAGRFAAKVGQSGVQSFVIQVDSESVDAADQVRFYKLLPGKKMQQISSYAFPDLEALQVAHKLKSRHLTTGATEIDEAAAGNSHRRTDNSTPLIYALALILVLFCILDWVLMQTRGTSIFTLQQILLLISAVALLAVPLIVRQIVKTN